MPLSSAGPRGDGVDGPGTYGLQRLPGHPGRYSLPAAPPIAATTVSAATVSATTGGCPTIGAPHPEHTRAERQPPPRTHDTSSAPTQPPTHTSEG